MIQDIAPSKLWNEFRELEAGERDPIFLFDPEGKVLLGDQEGKILYPDRSLMRDGRSVYLFSVDERHFFLSLEETAGIPEGFAYYTIREVRDRFPESSMPDVYAVFTAYHLWKWYAENRYCGKCGKELTLNKKERALVCPHCRNTVYPRINPAVIVGVTNGDRLLLTKYRTGYQHNALVAGFTEIGETLEETVQREVMEETGLRVKNIRYYKSQPWGMAQDLLMGFYCDAEDDAVIHMDENELKYAEWVRRDNIVLQPNDLSLTNDMMKQFKQNNTAAFA